MSVLRWLLAGLVLLVSRRGSRRASEEQARPAVSPEEQPLRPSRRAENVVLAALLGSTLAAAAFLAVYFTGADTQWLGVALGLALAAIGVACAVASRRLVQQAKRVEERPQLDGLEARAEVFEQLRDSGAGLTRRRLLATAAGGAGAALGAALVVPALSLGPDATARLAESPWGRGKRLVDGESRPLFADDLEVGSFLTAFPDGADREALASAVVVVRLRPDELHLPTERRDWAPEGILAFSKICTHAGCAIALFRYPLYQPTSPRPALVCPCHYSTFDVAAGGDRIFGPAGRALPQLPLALDGERRLVAAGGFSGRVGPSWLGVRKGVRSG